MIGQCLALAYAPGTKAFKIPVLSTLGATTSLCIAEDTTENLFSSVFAKKRF